MSYKKGKPQSGESRPMTSTECDATGLNRRVKHRVKVDRHDQVLVVVYNGSPVIYGPTTRVVQDLVAFWAPLKPNPRRTQPSEDANPTLLHPARKVVGMRQGRFPKNMVFRLECGHEHARPRRPSPPQTMRCIKCPIEKKVG